MVSLGQKGQLGPGIWQSPALGHLGNSYGVLRTKRTTWTWDLAVSSPGTSWEFPWCP